MAEYKEEVLKDFGAIRTTKTTEIRLRHVSEPRGEFYDLRMRVKVDGEWKWTPKGVRLTLSEASTLVDFLNAEL